MLITFVFSCYKWLFILSSYKNSLSVPIFAKFLGGPFLFSHLQGSLWVTFWLTLQYLATLSRENICVPPTSTQAECIFSWMMWLLKKEGFVCHENMSTCNYSWALDCFCHRDVFSTINWRLKTLDFPNNGFLFHTSESIICRKLPYKYIYHAWETIND